MIINYNSLGNGRDTWLKNDVGEVVGSPPTISKKSKGISWLLTMMMFIALIASQLSSAQVSFTQNWATTANAWTSSGVASFSRTTTSVCATTGSVRANLYTSATTGVLTSGLTGTATGGVVTMNYQYKIINFSGSAATPATFGSFKVQYASSTSGPWTDVPSSTISTNHVPSTSCVTKTLTFTPPAGSLYVRFTATWAAGDYYLYFDDVSLSEVAVACSGTPTPGNTTAPASVCSGVNFALGIQNATAGTGVTYSWQSADDLAFTTGVTTLGTASTQTTSQTAAKYYRVNVTCGGNTTASTPVLVPMSGFLDCYCQSRATTGDASDIIANVVITNITQSTNVTQASTGAAPYFTSYNNTPLSVQQGDNMSVAIKVGSDTNQHTAAWVDFNRNGSYDANENVGLSVAGGQVGANATVTYTFAVPSDASVGQTRLRVRGGSDDPAVYTAAGACTNTGYGETEDYLLNITALPACSGAPTPGNTTGPATICPGISFTLGQEMANSAGLTYQWESADDLAFTSNVVALGTSSTQTTSLTASKYYRVSVTCSGSTTISTPLHVVVKPYTECYCKPATTYGCADGDVVARVVLNTLDNTSGTGCPSDPTPGNTTYVAFGEGPGYSDYTGSTNPAHTTTLQAGASYNLSVYIARYSEAVAAWIDYNDNGIFEESEKVGSAIAIGSGVTGQISPATTFPISLACNPPVGVHRMRLRIMYNYILGSVTAATAAQVGPCNATDYGETEDYLVTITEPAACPQPSNLGASAVTTTTANLTWTKGCAETAWKVVVQPAGTGVPAPGAGVAVTGSGTTITYPVTYSGPSEYYVRADCAGDGLSLWTGPFAFGPPSCTTQLTPANGATGVSSTVDTVLSWTPVTGATSYDVYRGLTSTTMTSIGNTTGTSGTIASAFATTYFWQVIPKNAVGSAVGCSIFSYTTELPPAGDICSSAISLDTLTSPVSGTTVGFSNDLVLSCDLFSDDTAADVFYKVTVPAGYILSIGQTANNYDSVHAAFYGTCEAVTQITCVDDSEDGTETNAVVWTNTTGAPATVFWVQDGYDENGTYTLAWSVTPPPLAIASIDNDSTCSNDLANTGVITLTGTEITGVTSIDLNGIPVNYTVVNDTTIEITLIPANYASYTSGTFAIYSDTPVAYSPPFTINVVDPIPNTVNPTSVCLGEELTFFNEVPGEWTSDDIAVATILGTGQLTPVATGTVNLRYTVSNPETGCTSFRLYPITVNEPVYVVSNTVDPTAAEGGSTTISVSVDGTGPYTYLWEVKTDLESGDFEPITLPGFSNMDSANLLLTNADASYDGYQLRATITGACGSTQTEAIDLHVQATGFETQPAATVTVCAHNTTPVSFSVVASPDVTTYEWFVNTGGIFYTSVVDGGIFSGQGTDTLSLTNVTIENNGWKFRVVVTGNAEATSSFGTLIVNDSPAITVQPNSPEVCFSGAVNTPITLTSTGASSYQWLYSTSLNGEYLPVANGTPAGSLYSGAATANLGVTTTSATPVATYYYKVNLISSCSTLLSDAAQLTVNGASITGQPAATSLIPGGTASYTVAATTSLSPSYQWQYSTSATTGFAPVANGTPAGATYTTAAGGATLNIATLGTTPLGTSNFYRAVVTSGTNGCSVTTNAARLTIASYCSNIVFADVIEPITSVVFAGINNTSSATDVEVGEPGAIALEDFTAITGNVTTQNTYEMRIKGNSVGNYTNNYRVFIDWNKDGDFADAGETYNAGTITNSTGVDGLTAVSSITVPAGALPGTTRMRVKKIFGTDDLANPCLGADYGQVEDYSLNVTTCTPVSWYADTDSDGYGNTATLVTACISPAGTWVHVGGDCDDTNTAIYRTGNFYADADNDGYTVGGLVSVCYGLNTPTGYKATSLGTDCDDTNVLIYRTGSFYVDADNDTFYNGGLAQTEQCYGATTPSGFVPVGDNSGTDCDDTNGQINSNHVEVLGNETDDNCDGTNNEVAPLSNLLASHCGSTLAHISNTLFAVQVPTAQGYRFEISINGNNPRYFDSATNHFSLLNIPGGVLYNTTYTVRVAVKTNDFWRAYSTTCLVTTPPIPAKTFVSPAQCGTTVASMSTTIFAVQATSANQYRFAVSDGVTERTYDSAVNRFSFAALGGLSYNTTYSVRVALRFGTTWEDYGTACNITTPLAPPTSNVIPSLCGTTISNGWTTIFAMQVPEATGYRFNVTAPGVTRFYDTPDNRFSLRNIPSFTVTPNTTYTITVQILYNGFYQTAGSACTITTAGVVTRQAETAVSVFDVKAYPNPYADTFKFDMNTSSEETVNVKVYDMLGKQIESREFSVSELGTQEVGTRYSSGVYNIIVTQGENVKTLRVIKR